MKRNLQLGKAICATLLLVLMSFVNISFAQTQVATLQHGEEFSAFYGVNALVEAHEAAVDGDIITLSSGGFAATDISKAITLRGAGVTADTNTYMTPTYVNGDFLVHISNESLPLNVEGIFFKDEMMCNENNLYHASFTKCNIEHFDVSYADYTCLYDVQFVNCLIKSMALRVLSNVGGADVSIINSAIDSLYTYDGSSNYVNVYNSIVRTGSCYNLYLHNSILMPGGGYYLSAYNSYAYNCVITNSISFPEPSEIHNCMQLNGQYSMQQLFVGYSNEFFDSDFHLTDLLISFQGSDGTQVGIYGGAMPYNPRPSYIVPHVTTVAGQSDSNGNLSVDVEIVNENK